MQTRPWQKMVSGCVLREAVYELVTGTIRLLYDLVQVRYETTRRYSLFTYLLQRINRKIVRKSCIALGRSKHAADFSFLSLSLSLSLARTGCKLYVAVGVLDLDYGPQVFFSLQLYNNSCC